LGCDDLGSGEEVFGAIAEAAGAEGGFARASEKASGWEKMVGTAQGVSKAGVDLADLDDLFKG
jgi:hypothetical protein